MKIEGQINEKEITISDEDGVLTMTIKIEIGGRVVRNHTDTYKNKKELSASLRDEVGLGPALDFLSIYGVPRDDELYSLNQHR